MKNVIKIFGYLEKAKTFFTVVKVLGETIEFAKGRFEEEFKKAEKDTAGKVEAE